ncbi:cupin domain-containing protein [Streptomyces vinaceus]|uniref:cupin domain-containing protein n=1 Tax=Streptomyces vinaceus TaxID=1960 RepID=UPI00380F1783
MATTTGTAAASPAGSTPSPSPTGPTGVTATTEAQGSARDGIKASTTVPTKVTFRTVTLAPGGSTGWHYHPGPLLAVVKSGTLTEYFYNAGTHECTVRTHKAGTAFVEDVGNEHHHIGINRGTTPVELATTYIMPAGSQLAVPVAAPSAASCKTG